MAPLRGAVKEILLCDTGSRDQTRSLAARLGARVFRERLNADFGALRNRMIERANQPWILMMDADSRVSAGDLNKLRPLLNPATDALKFERRNYSDQFNVSCAWHPNTGEYPPEEKFARTKGYYTYNQTFLFKNHPAIRYQFPVHERLPDLAAGGFKIRHSGLVMHHFEYVKGNTHHIQKHLFYIRLARKMIRRWPRNERGYCSLISDLLLTREDLTEALTLARVVTRQHPRYAYAWVLRAVAETEARRYSSAAAHIRTAVRLDPSAPNRTIQGWIAVKRKRYREAFQIFSGALAIQKDNPLAYNLLGIAHLRTGRDARALACFKEAARLHPRYPEALFNKAVVEEKQGLHAAALADYRGVYRLTGDPEALKIARSLEKKRNGKA